MLFIKFQEYCLDKALLDLNDLSPGVKPFDINSEVKSIFKMKFWGNPFLIIGMLIAQGIHIGAMYTPNLKDVLRVQPVTFSQWIILLCFGSTLLILNEGHKLFWQWYLDEKIHDF